MNHNHILAQSYPRHLEEQRCILNAIAENEREGRRSLRFVGYIVASRIHSEEEEIISKNEK